MAMVEYTRTGGAQSADRSFPRFFMHPVQDQVATAREGRPIYRDEERVEIIMPGVAHLTKPVEKVTDVHRERWPKEYEAFKKGQGMSIDGTPIEEWPILQRAQVLELKALEIHTIEQCAALSDLAVQRIGRMGYAIRERAKAYLDEAAELALVERLTKEREEQDQKIADLSRRVEELTGLLSQTHAKMVELADRPNPLATLIPGMMDPAAQAAGVPEQGAASSLDALAAPVRRRGRPPKAA